MKQRNKYLMHSNLAKVKLLFLLMVCSCKSQVARLFIIFAVLILRRDSAVVCKLLLTLLVTLAQQVGFGHQHPGYGNHSKQQQDNLHSVK